MTAFRQCSISAGALLAGCVAASLAMASAGLIVKTADAVDLPHARPVALSAPFALPSNWTAEVKAAAEKATYIARCTKHIKALILDMDWYYTDAQLRTSLLSYCISSKEHPWAYADGFKAHKACAKFANKLHAIRHRELIGKKADYGAFCAEAYDYRALPRKTTTVSR
mmetsp:Transcript_110834/g.320335  ORF Transcript_110834/g.320335 Transcript_110834/m.320335 type:complete len:168 (-) Transcript_110834:102-605(-)